MSALQDSSHSHEQSLEHKPSDVNTHLLTSPFDVMASNKIKTLTAYPLLSQSLPTPMTIVTTLGGVPIRGQVPQAILHQALIPHLTSDSSHQIITGVNPKIAFPPQQVAVNLTSHAISTSGMTSGHSQSTGPSLLHPSIYNIGQAFAGRQLSMVTHPPQLSTQLNAIELAPPRSAALAVRMTTFTDIRHPLQTTLSHLPRGAVAGASIVVPPKSGQTTVARSISPATATGGGGGGVLVQPTIQNLVRHPSVPHQKILPVTRAVAQPRTITTTSSTTTRIAGFGWPNTSVSMTAGGKNVISEATAAAAAAAGTNIPVTTILQHGIRLMSHQTPLAMRPFLQTPKMIITSPMTSTAKNKTTAASNVNATRVLDVSANHTLIQTIARPASMINAAAAAALPVISVSHILPGGSNTGQQSMNLTQNLTKQVMISTTLARPAMPTVHNISINKMGGGQQPVAGGMTRVRKNIRLSSATTSSASHPISTPVIARPGLLPVVSVVQTMTNVGLKSATLAPSLTATAAVPVAKVPPQAFTVQQLTIDGQSSVSRLISPGGQPVHHHHHHQQQQRPGSLPQNAMFLGSGISLPMTSNDGRHQNEQQNAVLHHLSSYAIQDGSRFYAPSVQQAAQLMNLSNTVSYGTLQPVQAVAFAGSSIRPGLVTNQTSTLAASLNASIVGGAQQLSGNAVIGMANQNNRLVMMDSNRFSIHHSYASNDIMNRSSETMNSQSNQVIPQPPTMIALMQPPPQQQHHQQAATSNTDGLKQQTMSPRPPILRKRTHDILISSTTKKNLFSETSSDVSQTLVIASPKSFDASRENSQSSTDTASSAESTPRSCPPSVTRIKNESQDCFENGLRGSTKDPGLKIIPRKKPRKQSLHANEEIHDGFSTDEDDPERPSIYSTLKVDQERIDIEPEHNQLDEYVDEDGCRWSKDKMMLSASVSLAGQYNFNWKPRNNHFQSAADIKPKEDKKTSTVNELSNMKGIQHRASASRICQMSGHFEEVAENEATELERMQFLHSHFVARTGNRTILNFDEELQTLNLQIDEIVQANMQRCRSYIDQLNEARVSMMRILNHTPRAYEVIAKHQSKRTVKKKERS